MGFSKRSNMTGCVKIIIFWLIRRKQKRTNRKSSQASINNTNPSGWDLDQFHLVFHKDFQFFQIVLNSQTIDCHGNLQVNVKNPKWIKNWQLIFNLFMICLPSLLLKLLAMNWVPKKELNQRIAFLNST